MVPKYRLDPELVARAERSRLRLERLVVVAPGERPEAALVRAYACTWARVPRADARKRKEQP